MSRLYIFCVCFTVFICRSFAQGDVCNHHCVRNGTCNSKHVRYTCYYLFRDTKRTWTDSKHHCESQNLSIGQIQKGLDTDGLFLGLDYDSHAWQGGISKIMNLDQVEDVHGRPFQEIKQNSNSRKCGTAIKRTGRGSEVSFKAENCTQWHKFICSFGTNNPRAFPNRLSWFAARSTCIRHGGDLFHMNSSELLTQMFRSTLPWDEAFYIGAKNFKWVWPDGTEIENYNWAPDEPGDIEDCITIDGSTNTWHDWLCNSIRHYTICQKAIKVHEKQAPTGKNTGSPIMPTMLGVSAFINVVMVVAVMCLCRQHKCLFARKPKTVKDEEDEHAYADITYRPDESTPLEDRPTHDGAGSRPEVNIPMAEDNTQGPARIDIPNHDQEHIDDYLAPCDPVWHNRQKQQHETEETLQASSTPASLKMAPENEKSRLQVAKHTVNNGASGATSQDDEPKYLEIIASPEDIGQVNAGNKKNMRHPQPLDAALTSSRLSNDESYDYVGMPPVLPPQMKEKDDKSKKNESYVDMESPRATSPGHKEENTSRNGMNEDAEVCADDDHDEYDDVIGTSTENQYMALGSEEESAAENSFAENMYTPLDKKTMSKK